MNGSLLNLLRVTVICIMMILPFITACHSEEVVAGVEKIEKEQLLTKSSLEEQALNEDLEIIDMLLPAQNSRPRTEAITHVIIHFMSNVSRKPHDPYNMEDIYSIFEEYGFSAHYVIGRDGEIYRLVPEDRVAFHAGSGNLPDFPEYKNKLNDYSIGIELLAIGTREEMSAMISGDTYDSIDPSFIGFTEAQYESLNALLDEIIERDPSVIRDRKHIVGHDEYTPGRKTDPGSWFDWSKIGF
ncbi:N-acetyl-anhydromuramyl-L-alanine amidase AmpD [Caldalkalibacillus uzonensis]|uniref:N-acetylmuramoyl-L-alanine amidase n=1 Tax=Caldalkalibacillus uzonensis TaxID=353224 RepID=A0ABU0CV79_9BACI|nr:N-acetylmuramoyl-L-alanine amidase [Caldalkalibacillus uzonensis]MDQ0339993.1 N-acetyl-anhydromuramyl-L-alanine amidase AmpD [Caldalkalibacillus uzonensis]